MMKIPGSTGGRIPPLPAPTRMACNRQGKFLASVPLFSSFNIAWAGNAILFNDDGLTDYVDKDKTSGFYSAVDSRFLCYFLFYEQGNNNSVKKDDDKYITRNILTFVPGYKSQYFKDRDKTYDIYANYIKTRMIKHGQS